MDKDLFLSQLIKKFQLSEKDGQLIAEAFRSAVDEKASQLLQEHDNKAKSKLKEFLKVLDEEHAKKLKLACEAVAQRVKNSLSSKLKKQKQFFEQRTQEKLRKQDIQYAKKLVQFVESFKETYKRNLSRNKNQIIRQLIKEGKILPTSFVKKETDKLIHVLATYLDKTLSSDPILKQLKIVAENNIQLQTINKKMEMLKEENEKLKAQLKLEQLLSNIPLSEQKMMKELFQGKPLEYITEHFDQEYQKIRKINRETLIKETRQNLPDRFKSSPAEFSPEEKFSSNKNNALTHTYIQQLRKK